MASIISAGTTSGTALNLSGDTTGILQLASNGTTTAVTIGTDQKATFVNDATISGLTVGKGAGSATGATAVGASALQANTSSGTYNVAVGYTAGYSNTSATRNVAVGAQALYTNSTGEYNTALGMNSMQFSTSTSFNTCVGYSSGNGLTTGTTNTMFGAEAGTNLTTGAFGLYVGFGSRASVSGAVAEMVICTTGTTVAGKGNTTGFINPNGGGVYQGNNSSSWSTTSDRRLKKNIVDNTEGLDKITAIRIRNFEYKLPEEVTELDQSCAVAREGVQLGVIAQELREVCPDCVKEESTGVISVDSDNIFWHMINAIKELKAINDTQAATITALTARIVALETV